MHLAITRIIFNYFHVNYRIVRRLLTKREKRSYFQNIRNLISRQRGNLNQIHLNDRFTIPRHEIKDRLTN